ncbi:hypothetical protein Tco_0190670 [Tanacetum coccineum]
MLRVQENQDRFRELGVKNIAKSLTSLAVAENTKKRRKKDRDTNDKDVEYNPNDFDESEENYQEVATHVSAPKKEQMKNYKPPENESSPTDPFLAVMNKEYDEHLLTQGWEKGKVEGSGRGNEKNLGFKRVSVEETGDMIGEEEGKGGEVRWDRGKGGRGGEREVRMRAWGADREGGKVGEIAGRGGGNWRRRESEGRA